MSKRILITYPNSLDAPGGGTRSCLAIARHLDKMGVEVIIVSIGHNAYTTLPDSNISVVSVKQHSYQFLLSGLSVKDAIQNILNKKQNVDAVIGWEYENAFSLSLLRRHNIPFCIIAAKPSYSDYVCRESINWIKKRTDEWFRWRLLRQADTVFVSSDFTKQELISLFGVNENRIEITRRGINPLFHHLRSQPPEAITNLIFYGSLAPVKGVFDTIDALGLVAHKGYRNWKLKIAGWGDEQSLIEHAQEKGIADNIVLQGCLSPSELVKELAWAHLAVLPSRAESFGRAIAEAQASGLAVVSYNLGSIPEVVENGTTAYLVPFQRTDLLADAIIKAMDDPLKTFQMGQSGQRRVAEKFTWEKTASAILDGVNKASSVYTSLS